MIKIKSIEKYYSAGSLKTYVLRDISLDVREGEFISIMGPSGSGKSTILHILGMLDTPTAGEYYFFDEAVHNMKEKKLDPEVSKAKQDFSDGKFKEI